MADRKTFLLLLACFLQVLILLAVFTHAPIDTSYFWTHVSEQPKASARQQGGDHKTFQEKVARDDVLSGRPVSVWSSPPTHRLNLKTADKQEGAAKMETEAIMDTVESTEMSHRELEPAEPSIARQPVQSLSLLLIVKTGPDYFQRREVTRRLWFSRCTSGQLYGKSSDLAPKEQWTMKQVTVECLFLTGTSANATVMRKLREEIAQKGDVFLAPFADGYDRMTSKTQWSLMWSLRRDNHYDYLMMVDDDAYVVFRHLIPWLLSQPRHEFYSGHLHFNRGLIPCSTDPGHPNCVDASSPVFKGKRQYPPFASGFAYILSRDVVQLSVQEVVRYVSDTIPGNIEDAVLGTLLNAAGVSLRDEKGFVHWADERGRCPANAAVIVVGNVPANDLAKLEENDRTGKAICFGL
ncbi:UDP-GalNAc:beta-1,3-N-acetylgalactosaminyltransferase 1-like [Sycon ciliatum]|uniref:UDP-GalNAc:beta-1, 3-N-acetylgalactosaminyltransferase 1-like n=1 Tax=Sycon ciliatum TaxID=27933 RepID=UPI0031F62F1A